MYNEKIMEEFRHPQNAGEIKDADGTGKVGNPTCGDVMQVQIKVDNNKLTDVKFKTYGCVAAVAASSMMTQLAKGKAIDEAKELTKQDVINSLGGDIPPIKVHCSVLAVDALKEAIKDYEKKSAKEQL